MLSKHLLSLAARHGYRKLILDTDCLFMIVYLETKYMEHQLTSQDKMVGIFVLAELTGKQLLFCRKFLKIK